MVGILDVTNNGVTRIIDIKQFTPHLFYLNISYEQLLRQFYTRIVKIGESDPSLWKDIAQGRKVIPSSKEKLEETKKSKQQHENIGYLSLTKEDILLTLQTILK